MDAFLLLRSKQNSPKFKKSKRAVREKQAPCIWEKPLYLANANNDIDIATLQLLFDTIVSQCSLSMTKKLIDALSHPKMKTFSQDFTQQLIHALETMEQQQQLNICLSAVDYLSRNSPETIVSVRTSAQYSDVTKL